MLFVLLDFLFCFIWTEGLRLKVTGKDAKNVTKDLENCYRANVLVNKYFYLFDPIGHILQKTRRYIIGKLENLFYSGDKSLENPKLPKKYP